MKKFAALLLVVLLAGRLQAQTLPVPKNLISFTSPEGQQLLLTSQARSDYWPLSTQFVTQKNGAYCGVASSVMILNALGIPAPRSPEYGTINTFTQENFFTPAATAVVSPEVVARQGMTLEQLGQLLATYPLKVTTSHTTDTTLMEFRQRARAALEREGDFVLVNYLRKSIGEETGGHISPLAAYHEPTDRFLVLDVSRYKYPPVWVKTEELWRAMDTVDTDSGKTRGFIVVEKKVAS